MPKLKRAGSLGRKVAIVADETSTVVRFGPFQLDLASGEMRRDGRVVALQLQPLKVLALLVCRSGQIVSRDEIRRAIWGSDTVVDFEASINFCIRQIRVALGDNASKPRYIETLTRRGYRFLGLAELPVMCSAPGFNCARVGEGEAVASWTPTIAVLPFEDLGSAGEEYFVDGLTEALITTLTQISGLRVISRSSVMRLKGVHKPMPEIARELKVDYVVEGTVLRMRDRARIAAQLVKVSTDRPIWAASYDRNLRDILMLQVEVARALAHGIHVKLTPSEQERLSSTGQVNPNTYEAYLLGRFFWGKRTNEGFMRALGHFEQAIRIDPDCALGYVGLADCYNMLGHYVGPPAPAYSQAKHAALKALSIDPNLAEARTSLACLHFIYDRDWPAAEAEFRRAIDLNPNHANAHHWFALYLAALGRLDEAISVIRRAHALDPLSLIINQAMGLTLYFARQYDNAIEICRRALELDSRFVPAHGALGLAYEQKGHYLAAAKHFARAVSLSNRSPEMLASLAHFYAVSGKKEKAHRLLRELKRSSTLTYVSPYDVAVVLAGLGEQNQAFAWLRTAYAERSTGLVWFGVDPRLAPLHSNTRFRRLVHQLGLQG